MTMTKYPDKPHHYLELDSKVVEIGIERRFQKFVRSPTHLINEVLGWAIDMNTLEELDQEDVQDIWVIDTDTGLGYQASLSDFAVYGLPVHNSQDRQLCLPLQYWSVSR